MTGWTQPSIFELATTEPQEQEKFYCENCRAVVPTNDKPLHAIDQDFTKRHAPAHAGWTYHLAQAQQYEALLEALLLFRDNLISWEGLVSQYKKTYAVWNAREGSLVRPVTEAGVSWSALTRAATHPRKECWRIGARTIRPYGTDLVRFYCLCGGEYRTEKALTEHLRKTP